MKRRREVIFETERLIIRGELPKIIWCEACSETTPMVTAELAAILAGEETEHICRRAEQYQVHSTKTAGGLVMICLKSLSAASGNKWHT